MENQQLLQHIGKTKTDKLLLEIKKEFLEIKHKQFGVVDNQIDPISIVTTEKDKEIQGIGMSCINDLLLDNFGKWFAMAFGGSVQTMNDISNVARAFRGTAGTNRFSNDQYNVTGSQMMIGQGLTPAALTDFYIETPFSNGGLEDSRHSTVDGVYFTGLKEAKTTIQIAPTAGSGSVSETIFLFVMRDDTGAQVARYVTISRDNISPVVPFVMGNQINVEYSFIFN